MAMTKKECRSSLISQNYSWVLVAGRVLIVMLVGMSQMQSVSYIIILLPMIHMVTIVWKQPYLRLYNNYRDIFNEAIIMTTLCVYGTLKTTEDISTLTEGLLYLPVA